MKIFSIKMINYNDIAIICGNMSRLYDEGISFNNILDLIQELPLSKQYINGISNIKASINQGNSLYNSFNLESDIFPKFFLAMVDIGEKTGRINEIFKGLESYYTKMKNIQGKVFAASIYPIILFIAFIIMIVFAVLFALPSFADIYISMDKEIPFLCLQVIKIKSFISNNKVYTISIVICWGVVIPYCLYNNILKNKIIKLVNKISIYKLYTEYIMIVLLSVIMNSGINVSKGLDFCSKIDGSHKRREAFMSINKKILVGCTFTESIIDSNIFSKYSLAHMKIGEDSGTLDRRLILLEKELYEKIIFKINKDVELIQPIMIALIGSFVLIFLLIFVLPLFNSLMIG